jgi:post-segregation antitoxin (ccd killing protein)
MAAKKQDRTQMAAFIAQGTTELAKLRPEQRGIVAPAAAPDAPKPKAVPTSKRFTVNLPMDLISQARQYVANTVGITLSDLVDEALRKELADKAATLHPTRAAAAPKKGRPVRLKA